MDKLDLSNVAPAPCDILTVEQFAERVHVSRATVFAWMQRGLLVAGRHYFKFGRVIRFPWSAELIANLLQASTGQESQPIPVQVKVKPVRQGKRNSINWDY